MIKLCYSNDPACWIDGVTKRNCQNFRLKVWKFLNINPQTSLFMFRKKADIFWILCQNDLSYHKTSHYPCTGFNIKTTPHAFAIACVFLLQFDRPICENNSPKVYTPQSLLFIQTVESGMEPLLFLSLSVCMYFYLLPIWIFHAFQFSLLSFTLFFYSYIQYFSFSLILYTSFLLLAFYAKISLSLFILPFICHVCFFVSPFFLSHTQIITPHKVCWIQTICQTIG